MGLTAKDVADITAGWAETVAAVHAAALAAKRWIFQLFTVVGAPPSDAAGCAAYFRANCQPNATVYNSAVLFSFSGPKSHPLPSPMEDLAAFLLIRGPFAWSAPTAFSCCCMLPKSASNVAAGRLGYQWVGCVDCSPAIHVPPAPKGLCDPATAATGMYERPAALDGEYGEPVGQCKEVGSGGVFEREWTKATVRFDCGSWKGSVTPK